MTSPAGSSRRAVLAALGGALLAACTGARSSRNATGSAATASPSPTAHPLAPAPVSPAQAARRGAQVVRHADSGRPQVALTFHGSGDTGLAVHLLTEAERAGAKVTVFAVGTWLQTHPEMAARILHGGHALGNHTYTHPTLHTLSPSGIRSEVDRCAAVLKRLTGSPGAAFRPSGGPSITAPMISAATAAGYPFVVGFDVDPSDYRDPGASAVVSRVLAAARPGSIISLHLGHQGTVDALPQILSGLRSRGLQAVTTPVLLAPR
jgi:peptidoglycan/xylan/chitin deacetylase (PgdA/CDA1 family)